MEKTQNSKQAKNLILKNYCFKNLDFEFWVYLGFSV